MRPTTAPPERVAEIMIRNPSAVSPRTTVHEAQERLDERRIRHLLVMDGGELLGVLCACDLRDRPPGAVVSAYMSAPVRGIPEETPLGAAADLMRTRKIGCLAVVRQGVVRGLVTRGDLRRAGVPIERLAERFCAACHSDHDLVADGESGVVFCFDCIERSHPADDEYDLGCTD